MGNLPEDLAPRINVIHGDSTVKDDVVKALQGQDGVIVALGTRHDLSQSSKYSIQKKPISFSLFFHAGFTTVMSDSLKLILDTMLETGVKKVSVCLSCMYSPPFSC